MHAAGIEAVRTGIVRDERLLTLADTLGLALFQDLPVRYLPAARLADTLQYATRLLDEVIRRARRHPSARHVGLAQTSATSDPAACAYLQLLSVRAREAGLRSYYTTLFPRRDTCGHAVDVVLLDVFGSRDPARAIQTWRQAHPGRPVGVAALGVPVVAEAAEGLAHPRSPQTQARYLEQWLPVLLRVDPPVQSVFVASWGQGAADLDGATGGLAGAQALQPPARQVVAGVYQDAQRVFAWPQGAPPRVPVPWAVLAGWGLLAALVVLYAASIGFRRLVPRYFTARGFYLEAVQRQRDLPVVPSFLLLAIQALGAGLIVSVAVGLLRGHPVLDALAAWDVAPRLLALLTEQRWLVAGLVALSYLTILSLWAVGLAATSKRRDPLAPGQALVLVAWPRWSASLVLLVAMVVAGADELRLPADAVALGLVAVLLLISLLGNARTLRDYATITRAPWPGVLLAIVTHPLLYLIALTASFAVQAWPEIVFLTHLFAVG